MINPTTIDTVHLHNQVRDQAAPGRLVIGWTGTHSTLKYLDPGGASAGPAGSRRAGL